MRLHLKALRILRRDLEQVGKALPDRSGQHDSPQVRDGGGQVTLQPHLPPQITRLAFPVTAGGKRWTVEVTQAGARLLAG